MDRRTASQQIPILDRRGVEQTTISPSDLDIIQQAWLVTIIGRRRVHAAQLRPGIIMATIYGTLRGARRLPIAEDSRTVQRQVIGGGTTYRHSHTYAWRP